MENVVGCFDCTIVFLSLKDLLFGGASVQIIQFRLYQIYAKAFLMIALFTLISI